MSIRGYKNFLYLPSLIFWMLVSEDFYNHDSVTFIISKIVLLRAISYVGGLKYTYSHKFEDMVKEYRKYLSLSMILLIYHYFFDGRQYYKCSKMNTAKSTLCKRNAANTEMKV